MYFFSLYVVLVKKRKRNKNKCKKKMYYKSTVKLRVDKTKPKKRPLKDFAN